MMVYADRLAGWSMRLGGIIHIRDMGAGSRV